MNTTLRRACLLLGGALLACPTQAQDSVSTQPCGSDAVAPWAAGAPATSEQRNAYVVDLAPLTTLWGTPLGIAPIVKASRSSSTFTTSVISAQALSRRQLVNQPFASTSYQAWTTAGAGVNNNPALNTPPGSVNAPCVGNQLGFAFAEFGTTDAGASYNGLIGGAINLLPSNPGRVYVTRVMAASNGCDNASNLAQFGMGTVDETGLLHYRGDSVGAGGGCAGTVVGNNLWQTRSLSRNPAVLNVLGGGFPVLSDASDALLLGSASTYNTPGTVPASVTGGSALLLASNFDKEYLAGPVSTGLVNYGLTHYGIGANDQRGSVGYTSDTFAALGGTHGVVGIIAKNGAPSDRINLFGINAAGAPQGKLVIVLPGVVTDNATGFVNLGGLNEFDHYHSQVAFRGGNSQVALGTDQAGNLLVAAEVDMPDTGSTDWPVNYIAVARITPALAVSWTMAGYNNGTSGPGGTGKPIVLGAGGSTIGRMVTLGNVTGGSPLGPSVSGPMIDSVGNIYFLSTIEMLATGTFANALLRAVYNPAAFSYELDLVFRTGDVFPGKNSARDWLISFLSIADSNSVDSGTAWSGNMNELAHGGQPIAALAPKDPRTLGGVIISAGIIYDTDADGSFDTCDDLPPGVDQEYNVLLYVGHRQWEDVGFALAGTGGLKPRLAGEGTLVGGSALTLSLHDAKPLTQPFLVVGLAQINAPFKGGTLVPSMTALIGLPPTDGAGSLLLPSVWPAGLPSCIDVWMQAVLKDAGAVKGFALSNGIHTRTP